MSGPPRAIPRLLDLPLVIETPRLRLRPLEERDAEDLFPLAADSRVTPFVSWAAHQSIDETRAFVRAVIEGPRKNTGVVFGIEHEGKVIGCVGCDNIRWEFRAWRIDRTEIGYWLGAPYWGKGIMSEAALAVTRWAFETLGLHKVTIGCIEDNVASRRIIEKIGFRFLCRQLEDVWRDGLWRTHLRYELLASEWADSTRTLKFSKPRQP